MTRIRAFQLLVIVSVALHLLWIFLPLVLTVTPDLNEAVRWSGYGGLSVLQHPLFYISITATKIVAAVGLLLFLSWGRWLQLAVLATGVAALPFGGVSVALPLDNVIGALQGVADGAILGLAFSSPIADGIRKDV
jgi:hypothetical protein